MTSFIRLISITVILFINMQFGYSFENSTAYYVENRGQIIDRFGCSDMSVRYSLALPGMNLHLRDGGFSYDTYTALTEDDAYNAGIRDYQFSGRDFPLSSQRGTSSPSAKSIPLPEKPSPLYFHRVDVKFVGANPQPEIIAGDEVASFSTYYTAGVRHSTIITRQYRTITYHELYPFIDVVFHVRGDGAPEYDVIVRPGGDVRQVKLQYEGQNSIALRNGAVELGLWGGVLTEHLPRGYESETNRYIAVNFTLDHSTVGFEVSGHSTLATVVIDPTPLLVWGRYFGGSKRDQAEDITFDSAGNLYMTGTTASTSNIATSGTYQSVLFRDFDVYIAKFTAKGEQIWGTYYGGLYVEGGKAIAIYSNKIVVVGSAESDSMATDSALQTTKRGYSDCFVAVFTSDSGLIQWATYIGGDSLENGYGVAVDKDGFIYVAGVTVSDSSIATPGAFQENYHQGIVHGDAFLAKLTPDGKRVWATYYGGEYDDYAYDVATDRAGNVYLAGATRSHAYIGTNGSHQPERFVGTDPLLTDAFLAKFTPDGNRLWATYYGGGGTDYFYTVSTDNDNNIYLCGWTTSAQGIASATTYRATIADTARGDAFVVKFNENGVRQWATYYGGTDLDFAQDLSVHGNGDVLYITGHTNSSFGIATQGAHQAWKSGGGDGFVAKFTAAGQFVWGTYYGGPGTDYANAVATDKIGNIVVTGWTESDAGIATSGSQQPFRRGDRDAFLGSFDPIGTGVETEAANDVAGLSVTATQENGDIRVRFTTTKTCHIVLRLADISGREAGMRDMMCESGSTIMILPAVHLSAGIYAVTVSDGMSVAGATVGIVR